MNDDTINDAVTMAGGAGEALGRIDKYELSRELGEGGFGTVYLAHDTVANVDVAVKGLPPEVKHNSVELESIRRNFALVKRLRHPNIVAVTDLHQALSVSYASKEVESKLRVFERDTMVVMDYAPGVTLAQWRRQFPGGKVPLDKAIAVTRQVASALDYAHGQKVLHRDVKPANVMVESADGGKLVARVLDFGLAAEIRSSMGRLSREIRDTSGTRPYMAPEQWKGERQGPATDQYALAAMFYELVVGEVPFASVFDCGDPAVMRLAVTTDAPAIPADLPKCVRRALAVALAKKPEDRFASCGEFAAALEGKRVSRRGAETQRKSGAGKVLAVLALAAVIGVGGLIYHQSQERRQAERSRLEAESSKGSIEKAGSAVAQPVETKDAPQPTRKDVDAIYVEARVQMGACGRLDPSDGFKLRIEDCQKSFDRAKAQYDIDNWAEAALAFTNVVDDCKTLIEQSKTRDRAKTAAGILAETIKVAQSAGAKEYAPDRFNSATDLAKRGRGEFDAFKFADAAVTYASAKSQFDLAAKEAEQAKQEEARKKREAEESARLAEAERREREAREAAERERRAKWRQEGAAFTINDPYGLNLTMKWCPAGSFTMGSPTTEEGRRYDVEAQHRVTLTKGFWMGETEVTQGQWKRLMDDETILDLARKGLQDDTEYMIAGKKQTWRTVFSMSKYDDPQGMCGDVSDDVPVYWVSWDDAVRFCRKLTAKERAEGRVPDGYEYRLPTEAEWEYACRAGETASLPNGMDIRILGVCNAPALDDIAWYGGNSSEGFNGGRGLDTSNWAEKQYPGGHAAAREVRSKRPNNWGLYDMIGNVWEWCDDWCGDYPYDSATNPTGPESGEYRIIRGGSWRNEARDCRPAHRAGDEPGNRLDGVGFRVALAPILSKDSGDVGASAEALASDKIQTNLVRVSANGGESAADTSWDALLYSESPQLVVHETQPVTLTDTTELQRKYNAKHGLSGTHRPSDDSDIIEGKEDAESARLRREMVEQQRRRLYPEYYENHPQKNSGNMQSHHVIENTLTEFEKSEGWNLLWDGRTFNGWLAVKSGCKEPPQKGWVIKDSSLTMLPVNRVVNGKWSPLPPEEQKLGGGGDIVTDKKFRDFVFKFDFRLTKNATSGVKYFYDETLNKGTSEEYQILESGHPDFNKGKDGNRRSAALYDILPAHADRILKDVGEWNTGMIVAKGAHVEHWLNGEKVLEYERGSDAFKAAVNASKYANWGVDATGKPQDWGEIPEGRILLQDHTDSMVSFRNLKIKKL